MDAIHNPNPWWRPFLLALLSVSVGLVLLSGAVAFAFGAFGFEVTSPIQAFFDVSRERNLPSWWNSGLLLVAALFSAGLATLRRRAEVDPKSGWFSWWAVAALLGLMSLDEFAGMHERLDGVWRRLFGENPLDTFQWLMLGAPLAVSVIAVIWVSVRVIPRATANAFLLGIAIFFAGAIGGEALPVILGLGIDGVGYAVCYHIEELLEFIGASVLCIAPLASVAGERSGGGFLLEFQPSRRTRPVTPVVHWDAWTRWRVAVLQVPRPVVRPNAPRVRADGRVRGDAASR